MGRQHQGMDRPGVRQVPEGSGEQGKVQETGCEIICGAPTTLAVEGQMMMMMMMIMVLKKAMCAQAINSRRVQQTVFYITIKQVLSCRMSTVQFGELKYSFVQSGGG